MVQWWCIACRGATRDGRAATNRVVLHERPAWDGGRRRLGQSLRVYGTYITKSFGLALCGFVVLQASMSYQNRPQIMRKMRIIPGTGSHVSSDE